MLTKNQEIERSIIKKYRKQIWGKFVQAVQEFEMVEENDKIAVCISGGKDSMLLAKCMQELKRHSDTNFDVIYIVMDPGYNPRNRQRIIENCELMEIPVEIFDSNIFNVVSEVKENPCYLCARMRRGHLYNKAKELGCNKIALGHHMDDVVETVLMNMIFNGQYSGMMPKLHSDNFEGLELIRPLYLIKEQDIIKWQNYNNLEFINCACSVAEKNIGKRKVVKELVKDLKNVYELADLNIMKSLSNVNLDTIINYKSKTHEYNFLDSYEEDNDGE